jgi:hypothetical protein
MNNLEDIVQIALAAHDKSWDGISARNIVARSRDDFELELRRLLMQTELKPTGPLKRDGETSATIRASPSHTYTINPPNLMGTWTTTQARAMGIPPTVTNKEILHG